MRPAIAAVVVFAVAAACDRKPTQSVGMFDVCSSNSRDDEPVTKRCGKGLRCMLMLNDHAARCYRACEKDVDCSALGADYRCEHANSHGPELGCTRRNAQ